VSGDRADAHERRPIHISFKVSGCIASKILDLGFTKIWDILRTGKTQAGTRDTGPEIRDVPGNTGRLATLMSGGS